MRRPRLPTSLRPPARLEQKKILAAAVAQESLSSRVTPRPDARPVAELLTDSEEDRTLLAVLVGMLREADR
jgi:hypothetical protein